MSQQTYQLSQLAQTHLLKIKDYTILNYSEMQWRDYKNTLLSGFQLLADNPGVGNRCDDIYSGGFYFPVGKHVAYFTKENGGILIVAVLGRSQLPERHLK